MLSEKLGPGLDDGIHGPVVTLDMGLGLFNVVVVKVNRLAKDFDVVLVRAGGENITELLAPQATRTRLRHHHRLPSKKKDDRRWLSIGDLPVARRLNQLLCQVVNRSKTHRVGGIWNTREFMECRSKGNRFGVFQGIGNDVLTCCRAVFPHPNPGCVWVIVDVVGKVHSGRELPGGG